jgi:hypothetical protein
MSLASAFAPRTYAKRHKRGTKNIGNPNKEIKRVDAVMDTKTNDAKMDVKVDVKTDAVKSYSPNPVSEASTVNQLSPPATIPTNEPDVFKFTKDGTTHVLRNDERIDLIWWINSPFMYPNQNIKHIKGHSVEPIIRNIYTDTTNPSLVHVSYGDECTNGSHCHGGFPLCDMYLNDIILQQH